MKADRSNTHAPCAVRYRARGLDLCGATDTPCEYCADREPNSANAIGLTELRWRRNPRRNRRPDRNAPPFEDS